MSGIYIPGAKIHDGDYVRVLMLHKDGTCVDGIGNVFKVVPVPPHGRSIDADALTISTAVPLDGKPYQYVHIDNIKDAPTIIPASEKEE